MRRVAARMVALASCGARRGHMSQREKELASEAEHVLRMTKLDSTEMPVDVPPPVQASTSTPARGGSAFDSQGGSRDWPEPTLADLDRSIPQIDCKFIADLIRTRNLRKTQFIEEKQKIKAKLTDMLRSRKLAETRAEEDALVAELSQAEKDILLHTRPEYNDGFIIIDCRTVNEITSWGIIEGSKVLPAHEMFEAFHMTPEQFEEQYGFPKPKPEETVIFYCQYGARSLMAAQILSWLGYENVLHFRDGYHEWGKQYNLLVRRWMEHDKESGNNVKRLVMFEAAKQLQREIAPEFNALPLKEAQKYITDETRSRGVLQVGEGVRERSLQKLTELTTSLGIGEAPIPGVLEDGVGSGRHKKLLEFLNVNTCVDGDAEPLPGMSLGEAQSQVSDTLFRGSGGTRSQ